MQIPKVEIPKGLKQIKKQIAALEYQIPLDTNEKDLERRDRDAN